MSLSVSATSSVTSSTTFDRSTMAENISKRMFADLDTDKSGTLDKKEYVAGLTAKGVSADEASKQFDAIDTKKTGKITQSDLKSAIENGKAGPPRGAKLPDDGASASKASGGTQAAGGGGGGAEKTYDAADTNKDGVVSTQEELIYTAAHPSKATSTSTDASKLGQVVDTTA